MEEPLLEEPLLDEPLLEEPLPEEPLLEEPLLKGQLLLNVYVLPFLLEIWFEFKNCESTELILSLYVWR